MEHARNVHNTDFSGLVTKLLVADLGEAYLQKNLTSRSDETIALLRRISTEEDNRLPSGPRAHKGARQETEEQSAGRMLKHAEQSAKKKEASRGARKAREEKKRLPVSGRR